MVPDQRHTSATALALVAPRERSMSQIGGVARQTVRHPAGAATQLPCTRGIKRIASGVPGITHLAQVGGRHGDLTTSKSGAKGHNGDDAGAIRCDRDRDDTANAFTSAGIGGTVRQNTRDDLSLSLDSGV